MEQRPELLRLIIRVWVILMELPYTEYSSVMSQVFEFLKLWDSLR